MFGLGYIFTKHKSQSRYYLFLFLFLTLSACGGGSSGGEGEGEDSDDTMPPIVNDPPEIDPPEIDPPEIDPPEIDPPEIDPPEDEAVLVKPAHGIFALDGAGGTFRDGNIRNYDFVDGYAWRMSWSDFELSEDNYDFTAFNHVIGRLAELEQELSLLVMPGFPEYLITHPDIDTWLDDGELKPSPWDPDLHERYDQFVRALADHQVADPAAGGELVALKNHSLLTILHPNMIGMPRGGLRDGNTTDVADVPGYSRENIAAAISASLTTWENNFPEHPKMMSLWLINDSDRDNPLWQFAQDEFTKFINIGIFQDNLQASQECDTCPVESGPIVEGLGQALIHETLWTGFQMLGSWANPSPMHLENLDGGIPEQGMEFALAAYGSLYFEVYVSDLDNAEWQESFSDWQELLSTEADDRAYTIP